MMMKLTKIGIGCLLIVMSCTTYANRQAEDISHIDINTVLPKFSGVNQLGKLALRIPESRYFDTANGVPVIFTPMHNLPIVDIDLDFKAGNGHDDEIRSGAEGAIASMTASMMMQGTKSLDEEAFNEKAESLAMALSVSSALENFNFSLRTLKEKELLSESVALMLDVYANPRFDETILARNKAQIAIGLQAAESSPKFLASRAFGAIMSKNDPKADDNAIAELEKLKTDELIAFKDKFLVAQNAKIAITGDLSLDEAKDLANKIASVLKTGQKAGEIKKYKAPTPIHYHIHHPSTQTYVMIGGVSNTFSPTKEGIQHYHDYTLGNSIMAGGDFNARLMQAIRVKKGYTYGISGGLSYNQHRGIYSIEFSTKNDDATSAIKDTLATIDEVLKDGITQAELDLEKTGERNSYPTRFGSHSGVHKAVAGVFLDGYPKDHLQKRFERLDNATVSSVNEALRHFVKPKNFVVVTVGAKKPEVVLPSDKQ